MDKEFKVISDILPVPLTKLDDVLFLTFDIDWAHDKIIGDTVDLLEKSGVTATWFVTHDTGLLKRLRENSKFELGIHPNFDFLLRGDSRNGRNAQEVIERLMKLVPEAKAIRSHSTTQSSMLFEVFKAAGLTHDCNHFIPAHINIQLKPWLLWNGMVRVPYFWEDDVACLYSHEDNMSEVAQRPGLKVFDFHPIHIFLNTEHLDRYERTRHLHHNPEELIKHRYEGVGTRTRLLELLQLAGSLVTNKEQTL